MTVCRLPVVWIRTIALPRSPGRRRRRRSIGHWRRCTQRQRACPPLSCFTVHLHLKDFADLSSMTMKQFNAPSLHVRATRRGLQKPSRCRRVSIALARCMRAHEKSHTAPALGGELQTPGLDLIQAFNGSDGCAHPAASQAFRQRPQLICTMGAAEQDELSEVDTHRCRGRNVKLSIGIAPCDRAAVILCRLLCCSLCRPGEQQRDGRREIEPAAPEQFMDRTALKRAVGRERIERIQAGMETARRRERELLCRQSATQFIPVSRQTQHIPLLYVCVMLG
jgi:hypothetical protein